MSRTMAGSRIVVGVCCLAALPAMLLGAVQTGTQSRAEFDAFIDKVNQAQVELFRGRAEPLKALWSRAADATLFGVLGGRGERGGDQVGPRLDWAGTQYTEGSVTLERIASYVEGNLGHVVQLEKVQYKLPGRTEVSLLEIRATWIFRRERDGWRILHRHADPQLTRRGPAEGK